MRNSRWINYRDKFDKEAQIRRREKKTKQMLKYELNAAGRSIVDVSRIRRRRPVMRYRYLRSAGSRLKSLSRSRDVIRNKPLIETSYPSAASLCFSYYAYDFGDRGRLDDGTLAWKRLRAAGGPVTINRDCRTCIRSFRLDLRVTWFFPGKMRKKIDEFWIELDEYWETKNLRGGYLFVLDVDKLSATFTRFLFNVHFLGFVEDWHDDIAPENIKNWFIIANIMETSTAWCAITYFFWIIHINFIRLLTYYTALSIWALKKDLRLKYHHRSSYSSLYQYCKWPEGK